MTKQNSFLLYWQERSVMEHASNDVPLDVVASNQLAGVFPGDTIWVVSLSEERELALTGRLVVGEIVEYEEAMQRMPDAGLWQAEYYAFPEDGTESFIRWMALNELAEELRFEDPDSDRFVFRDGKLNPQQLQSLRRLTNESAAILDDLWDSIEEMDPGDIMDPAEALEHYRAQVAENPNDAPSHYDLGVALGANGLPEDAVRAYRRSIELSPDYSAYYNLGSELLELDRIDEAIEAYNAAIFLAYEFSPAHFMLGVAYSNAERYEEAIQATQAGLKIDPDDPNAHFNIGRSYYHLGEFQRACEAFNDAIAVAPDFARGFYFKGICYRHLGEVDLEIDCYKKALDLVPDFFDAMFALGAAWAIKQSGSAEGIEFIEPNDTLELQDATHQFYLGLSFLALGLNDLMIDHIKHLRKLDQSLADRLKAFLDNEDSGTSTAINHPPASD